MNKITCLALPCLALLLSFNANSSDQFVVYDESKHDFEIYDRPWLTSYKNLTDSGKLKEPTIEDQRSCDIVIGMANDCIRDARLKKYLWGGGTTFFGLVTGASAATSVITAGALSWKTIGLAGITAATYMEQQRQKDRESDCQKTKDDAIGICRELGVI